MLLSPPGVRKLAAPPVELLEVDPDRGAGWEAPAVPPAVAVAVLEAGVDAAVEAFGEDEPPQPANTLAAIAPHDSQKTTRIRIAPPELDTPRRLLMSSQCSRLPKRQPKTPDLNIHTENQAQEDV
jgi:hypothetical protein